MGEPGGNNLHNSWPGDRPGSLTVAEKQPFCREKCRGNLERTELNAVLFILMAVKGRKTLENKEFFHPLRQGSCAYESKYWMLHVGETRLY